MPSRLSNATKKTGADPINTLSPAPTQGSPELTTLPGEPHDDLRFYREQQEHLTEPREWIRESGYCLVPL
jgi:hypothetical protein